MNRQMLQAWWQTARPKTLAIATASVLSGSVLAYWVGDFNGKVAAFCLITTLLLQVLSNVANDYGDYQHGSDTDARLGPLRGIQKGMITPKQLKNAMSWLVLACLLSGACLIGLSYQSLQDVVVFVLLGLCAIVAAIAYTVGNRPYGYLGLGDVSVFVFFGLLGVGGSYYVQAHRLDGLMLLPAAATGFLAVAVLNVNNMRDIYQDAIAGKRTLAVRLGAKNARRYHVVLVMAAAICYVLFAGIAAKQTQQTQERWCYFLVVLSFPWLWQHAQAVYRSDDAKQLRPRLAQISQLCLGVNVLFALGLILARLI